MRTIKLLLEFTFWATVVMGLILFNTPSLLMEFVKYDILKKQPKVSVERSKP